VHIFATKLIVNQNWPKRAKILRSLCKKMHRLEISTPQQQVARVGQSVESALIAIAAIFWLIARILTIFDKKYRNLTRRYKRESYLIVLQQNNV